MKTNPPRNVAEADKILDDTAVARSRYSFLMCHIYRYLSVSDAWCSLVRAAERRALYADGVPAASELRALFKRFGVGVRQFGAASTAENKSALDEVFHFLPLNVEYKHKT